MAGEAHEGPIGRGDLASLTSAVGRPPGPPNDHDDVGGLARGPGPHGMPPTPSDLRVPRVAPREAGVYEAEEPGAY